MNLKEKSMLGSLTAVSGTRGNPSSIWLEAKVALRCPHSEGESWLLLVDSTPMKSLCIPWNRKLPSILDTQVSTMSFLLWHVPCTNTCHKQQHFKVWSHGLPQLYISVTRKLPWLLCSRQSCELQKEGLMSPCFVPPEGDQDMSS